MTYQTIQVIPVDEIAPLLNQMRDEIASLRRELLNKPDETPLSDADAALKSGVSIPTLRRMKTDGRIGSVGTSRGRLVRVCDVNEYLERKR